MQIEFITILKSKIGAFAKTKDAADATIVIGGGGLTGVELSW